MPELQTLGARETVKRSNQVLSDLPQGFTERSLKQTFLKNVWKMPIH